MYTILYVISYSNSKQVREYTQHSYYQTAVLVDM